MSFYSPLPDESADAEAFLQSLPLFAELAAEQLHQIAQNVHRREFAAGITLYHQAMPGLMLYMIDKGLVRIFSIGRTGLELTLGIFGAGDVFGELSSLDEQAHSATAITLTPTVVWMLRSSDLKDFLARNPLAYRGVIQHLVSRIRSITTYTEAMTFQDVQGRLAYVLLSLAERHGEEREGVITIHVPLTQGDLASMVGATRESINKSLANLRTAELVRVDGSQLAILNARGLQRMILERGR